MATPSHFLINKNHFQIKIELAIEWKTYEPKCGVQTNFFQFSSALSAQPARHKGHLFSILNFKFFCSLATKTQISIILNLDSSLVTIIFSFVNGWIYIINILKFIIKKTNKLILIMLF